MSRNGTVPSIGDGDNHRLHQVADNTINGGHGYVADTENRRIRKIIAPFQ